MKLHRRRLSCRCSGRSREGAWIEMPVTVSTLPPSVVAPVRERGLKLQEGRKNQGIPEGRSREGAWIEILSLYSILLSLIVAPVRERGLKLH